VVGSSEDGLLPTVADAIKSRFDEADPVPTTVFGGLLSEIAKETDLFAMAFSFAAVFVAFRRMVSCCGPHFERNKRETDCVMWGVIVNSDACVCTNP